MKIKKHYTGCYRISNGGSLFGQIKKRRGERLWDAEIRKTETGDLVRFAGIWRTRKEAIEEIEPIIGRE